MTRLMILAEGQTEQAFIEIVLKKYLSNLEINVQNLKGGKISVERLVNRINRLTYNFDKVTTFIDYYGFYKAAQQKIECLEKTILEKVRQREKFIPYLQSYEFEALLFADKSIIKKQLNLNPKQFTELNLITEPPEKINHDSNPSQRLKKIYQGYDKKLNGVEITQAIGLEKIKEKCPRFRCWIETLQKLT